MIIVRRDAGIEHPKDLEGRRIGVTHFPMSAAVWIRGLLQDEYGVDLSRVQWVQETPFRDIGSAEQLQRLRERFTIQEGTSGEPLENLIADGRIDAYIGADVPDAMRANPALRRLFPDVRAVERDYFRRTGIFPIMHTAVIRREVYEEHPFIARSLFDAFTRSKDLAREKMRYQGTLRYMLPWMIPDIEEIDDVFGGDPFVYGLEPNRKTLETLARYLFEQSIATRMVNIDDIFVDVGA